MKLLRKGVSPLIATVILLAFVIAIAAMASQFFVGFTKKQKGQVEEKGGQTVDCSLGNVEIDKTGVDNYTSAGNISVIVENTGQIKLEDLLLVAYNQTDGAEKPVTYNSSEISTSLISKGAVEMIKSPHPGGTVQKITVKSSICPSVQSTVEDEDGDGTWDYSYS